MITRISEIIHEWMGWCPNGHTIRAKNSGYAGIGFRTANPSAKSPGPSGAAGSGMSWKGKYEHTQRGTLIIGTVSTAILLILATWYMSGPEWITIIVLGIMVLVLTIMSTLTVSLMGGILRIRFGPVGLVGKNWPVAEIVSVTEVTNPWYYGYGLRWTPDGRLYNVSGRGAVEILMFSGEKFRIGSDEPDILVKAILSAMEQKHAPS